MKREVHHRKDIQSFFFFPLCGLYFIVFDEGTSNTKHSPLNINVVPSYDNTNKRDSKVYLSMPQHTQLDQRCCVVA